VILLETAKQLLVQLSLPLEPQHVSHAQRPGDHFRLLLRAPFENADETGGEMPVIRTVRSAQIIGELMNAIYGVVPKPGLAPMRILCYDVMAHVFITPISFRRVPSRNAVPGTSGAAALCTLGRVLSVEIPVQSRKSCTYHAPGEGTLRALHSMGRDGEIATTIFTIECREL
jgi:hypothetical protein